MVVVWSTKLFFSDNTCQGAGEGNELSLTMGWVQQAKLPIQVSDEEHTTNFCWTNASGNGKYPIGALEGEGTLLGCR